MTLGDSLISTKKILLILALALFGLSLYFDSFLQTENLVNDPIVDWNEGWTISDGSTLLDEQVTLPYHIKAPYVGRTFTASLRLPDSFPNHNTCLAIDTSQTSLVVMVDDKELYRFEGPGKGWTRPVFGGSMSHFIRLDDSARGKELKLIYAFTSNNNFAGNVKIVQAGTKASLLLSKYQKWPSLVFGYSLLLLGVISVLFSFAIHTEHERKSFFYFGWILLALGGWVFSQAPSKLLVIRNPALPLNMSYAALYLLPIFITSYVLTSYKVHPRINRFQPLALLFVATYLVGVVLQFLGIAQLADLLAFSGLALGLYLTSFLVCLTIEYFKGNSSLASFLLAMVLLLSSILAEELLFLLGVKLQSAVLLHLGMALCAAVLFIHSVTLVKEKTKSVYKEQMLLSMAYTDVLTGLGNRSAYEKRVDEIAERKDDTVIGVLVMDVNNLKLINDTQGHKAGDLALKEFSEKIFNLLPVGSEVYRYGGDEFIALIPSISEEHLKKIEESMMLCYEKCKNILYGVAVGGDRYIPKKKEKFINVVTRADGLMYQYKARMKQ